MLKKVNKNAERIRRHKRVRKIVSGTPECPRLNVFRSNKHIYAQIIDDTTGRTLAASSSEVLKLENGGNIDIDYIMDINNVACSHNGISLRVRA